VHVLTARINATDHRKRTGVFGDQSDAHFSPHKNGFGRRRSGTPRVSAKLASVCSAPSRGMAVITQPTPKEVPHGNR
jgi:hypothetical protein